MNFYFKLSNAALVSLLIFSLSACSTALTVGGEKVQVRKSDPPANCKEVGDVSAQAMSHEGAKNRMRNQAAELGGNWVTLETAISGTAYRCPDRP